MQTGLGNRPEGRDRRPIDPPIILQLQILDFNPNSKEHLNDLKYTYWVVHCYLFNNEHPASDVSIMDFGDSGHGGSGIRKLLIGCATVNGLFAPEDPDPETAVPHPSSRVSSMTSDIPGGESFCKQPGTFFIFSDLSVRSPGTYRLKFMLMRIDGNLTNPGAKVPVEAEAMSNPFTVDNAKRFDKVQESTNLVRGLAKLLGAPSTLKIKKGPAARERAKRRREGEEEEESDEEEGRD
ncbi:putative velvet complex protein [Phaeomoniella chlamydospora]|uniref:Putative velvet complex protein n=1 Tax=Phaeomoniella chlamydospora TaxID=158046 RepID=A0A0G2GBW2_PHACM|nr:putative velvet complex protein [Phaeomoniella chlamydospora]